MNTDLHSIWSAALPLMLAGYAVCMASISAIATKPLGPSKQSRSTLREARSGFPRARTGATSADVQR